MKKAVDVSRSRENVKAPALGLLHLDGQSSWALGQLTHLQCTFAG